MLIRLDCRPTGCAAICSSEGADLGGRREEYAQNTKVASSVEGRPKGGGDPRVACRDQAGVQDDGSKMSMKSESEMWRLRKI